MDLIQGILKRQVTSNSSPSVQYVIFDKDHIIGNYNFGLADIKNNITASVSTTYHAFSVTKTFTALAVLQLAEQGKTDIDQPFKKYLPDFPYGDEITIRQVLAHSAGIPNGIPLSWIHLSCDHKSFDYKWFYHKLFLAHDSTDFKPDEKFAYSNLGYILLGELIESISGMSYEEYIIENIVKKLGLDENSIAFKMKDMSGHAKGYHKIMSFSNLILGFFIKKSKYMDKPEGWWRPFKPFYVNGPAYGGLLGTPYAFVKYVQEILKPASSLISANSKKLLFKENLVKGNKPTGMCLSWFSGQLNGNRYYTHAGGGGGYYCEIRIYPDKGIGSVIFFNRSGMSDERFLDKVDYVYFDSLKS